MSEVLQLLLAAVVALFIVSLLITIPFIAMIFKALYDDFKDNR